MISGKAALQGDATRPAHRSRRLVHTPWHRGLFLPFLQGIALIIVGLLLLGYKIERKVIEERIKKFLKWRKANDKDKRR